jgi:hypothetical protein
VCYIVNDLTNRELIRRKFKFEEFKIGDDLGNNQRYQSMSDEEDDIIQGSTVFLSPSLPSEKPQIGTRDLTDAGLLLKNQKRKLFQCK